MIVDFDDFCEQHHRLDLLERLHEARPDFRCTLFAIPAKGSTRFWDDVPGWCELAVHGWEHPHPREAAEWTREQTLDVLLRSPGRFVDGFKAPGWQISDGAYEAIMELGWWVADHWDNDHRRPDGIAAHVITRAAGSGEDPGHWHGHIPDVCGNGIAETFDRLEEAVKEAESFQLISESVSLWRALATA